MFKPKVIEGDFTGDKEAAKWLREFADEVEAGEILSFAVGYERPNCYDCFFNFRDKWRLVGALEYLKAKVSIWSSDD